MSEEKASGFQSETVAEGVRRIVKIGTSPWLMKECNGTANGDAASSMATAEPVTLQPTTLYYLIRR